MTMVTAGAREVNKITVPEHTLHMDVQEKASAAKHALLILMYQTMQKL
jgi:hypothetical protein